MLSKNQRSSCLQMGQSNTEKQYSIVSRHLVQMFAGQQASTNTSCWPAVVVYLDSEGCV